MTPERWRQIEDLYHSARDRGSEVLANADPELRREVEALLEQKSGGILDHPPFDPFTRTAHTLATVGSNLGPYRIEALLGRGGMGEVFRATDTRLGREVAIKLSQEEFTGRFEREARAVAALNHPNICTLHDVGPNYLVMELVEGETLAARLKRGRLPIEQTVRYGAQIAAALSAAHAKGIVHRDLKPGNVMIAKTAVKVLDFGLARSTQDETVTATNAVIGTPAYMAPEQREGKVCDARTDIYALGLVLFEMASGKRPQPDGPPQLESLPEKLARIVDACLAPDPEDRLQSAQDVKLELEWIRDTAAEPSESRRAAAWRRALPWTLLGVTVLLFALFAWVRGTGMGNQVQAAPVRLQIALPQKPPLQLTGALALSPDGRQLAFGASGADGIPRVYLRAMDSLAIRPLPGTENVGSLLFWKPDGRFLAFDTGGKLRKIDISGGPAQLVCSLNLTGIGGTWNTGGDILFGQFGGPIMRVSDVGGVAMPVTVLDRSRGDVAHNEPWFLPDGKHFLYLRDRGTDAAIFAGSLDAKPEAQDSKQLTEAWLAGAYVPSADSAFGQLLFLRGQTLMAQSFDAAHRKLSGDPVRVVEEPLQAYWDTGTFSVSANGTLVYWSPGSMENQLTWFDVHGKVQGTVGTPGPYDSASLSPDGTRAIVTRITDQGNPALWLLDMSRGTSTPLELDPLTIGQAAVWSPDGHSIIFDSAVTGQMGDIYQKRMDRAAGPEELIRSNEWKFPLSWSPDGGFLLYDSVGGGKIAKLWVLPLKGDRKPVPFFRSEFAQVDGCFSPGSRWVAYSSNETGRPEIYVRPFSPDVLGGTSNAGGKWLISENGGSHPIWRPDGKELYYIALDGKLMAVTVSAGTTFQASVPRVLFQAPPSVRQMLFVAPNLVASPDGQRFLFLAAPKQEVAPLTVVLNWQAGLKK